jgi:hypothetical protein
LPVAVNKARPTLTGKLALSLRADSEVAQLPVGSSRSQRFRLKLLLVTVQLAAGWFVTVTARVGSMLY